MISILVVLLEVLKCLENPEVCLARLAINLDLDQRNGPKRKKGGSDEKADTDAKLKDIEDAKKKM